MVGVRVVCNIWESSYSLSTYIYYLQIINMIFQFLLEGRRHDAGMLRDSHLLKSLQMFAFNLHGKPMCIYGDPAYPLRIHLQAPFRNGVLTPQMQAYNSAMSEVRSSVEWLFGDVINYFKFLDLKKNLKIGLLRNALTCLYGNQTSEFFELDPPSLQDYLEFLELSFTNGEVLSPNEKWNKFNS